MLSTLLGRWRIIQDFDDLSRHGLTRLIFSETGFHAEERPLLSITVLHPPKTLGRIGKAAWMGPISSYIFRGLRWVIRGYPICLNASAIALIGVLLP